MNVTQSIDLIATNSAIRGGRPCIAGTTLRVTDLVIASLFHNRTPDEISADFSISLGQVHAGLAYYYENKQALDIDIRQQIENARQARNSANNGNTSLLS